MREGIQSAPVSRAQARHREDPRTDRFFSGRREIKRLTGNYKVPTLVLDDGTVIDDSKNIVAWAAANPT